MSFNYSDQDRNQDDGGEDSAEIIKQNIQNALEELVANSDDSADQEHIISERHQRILEARDRVEHANLYLTIIKNDLFAAGSANSDVQSKVEEEFKAFAGERLAQLLGMKSPEPKVIKQESPFSEEETKALKMLAGKILPKVQQEVPAQIKSEPKLNKINLSGNASLPKVNKIQDSAPKSNNKPAPKAKKSSDQVLSKPVGDMTPQEAREELAKRRGSVPVGRSAQAPKPLPMPSFENQLIKAATEVEQNAKANPIVAATRKASV